MPTSTTRLTHALAAALAAACVAATPPARAVGRRVDVEIVDRDTGERISPVFHRGEWWIAGRPGARYAVSLANRSGMRTLSVISVDGVNAFSGETASWDQSGYVLEPSESMRVDGWRKNLGQIAAFEFTALPDSYAARTGRPANVGVIGVAVFDERPQPVVAPRPERPRELSLDKSLPMPTPPASAPARSPSSSSNDDLSASSNAAAEPSASDAPPGNAVARRAERLGTGHGAIERSVVRWTTFERMQSTPNEIVAIHYDRYENLVAMGIVPRRPAPTIANPFPGSGSFVPDPPPGR